MNLRQLEYFVVIAEEGSFTRAAERLLVAQPSLSQQIAALERELGSDLLERLPRGVRLTVAGQSFLPEARAALSHADRARRLVRMAADLEAGTLELAAATSASAGILPPVLRRWQLAHPEIEVSLREYPHRRLMDEGVRNGAGDMAVGSPPADWRGAVEHLGWEQFVAVLPHGDPLLAKKTVALSDLADRRWVHFTAGHGLAEIVDRECAVAGFSPRVAVRTSQVGAAPQFAAAGLGPALVPDHVVPESERELMRQLRHHPVRPVVAFTRGDWTPTTRAFLDTLHEYPWPRKPRAATKLR